MKLSLIICLIITLRQPYSKEIRGKRFLSTSPPVSPSPSKERGRDIKKRRFVSLRHPSY